MEITTLHLVGYGLAKFSEALYEQFGFCKWGDFYDYVAESGAANTPNTVNNERDRFDPFFDNGRRGWQPDGENLDIKKRKERLDSLHGELSVEEYAAVVRSRLESHSKKPSDDIEMPDDNEDKLKKHRARIDAIDADILALMNRRLEAAQRIGALKAAAAQPSFYRPEREARVLRRLRELNPGPLDDAALEALFREIMSISRGSEAGLSVAILGPLGTYTEAAARAHFGTSPTVEILPFSTIDEIFRAAETGQTDFAVAPVENSTEGGVSGTLDRLATTSLLICGEIHLRIHHNLLGAGDELQAVKRVMAHAQSLAQCRRWLCRNLPGAQLISAASNAEAAIQAQGDPSAAAIAGDSAAARYGLNHLAANIEDEPGNATRFLLFSSRPTPPSGDDKTSLLLSCRNRPGALFHLLKPLMERGVDMTRIESRPSRTGLWEYIFFVDILGHPADPNIAETLKELRSEAGLYKNLGSYPVSS